MFLLRSVPKATAMVFVMVRYSRERKKSNPLETLKRSPKDKTRRRLAGFLLFHYSTVVAGAAVEKVVFKIDMQKGMSIAIQILQLFQSAPLGKNDMA